MTTNGGKGGFTKGPWVVEGEGIRMLVRHVDSGGVILATRHRVGGKENESVMRLIASAPDLLEALKELMDSYPGEGNWQQVRTKARAAIARAEGEGL